LGARDREIARKLAIGWSVSTVAAYVGCHRATVWRAAKRPEVEVLVNEIIEELDRTAIESAVAPALLRLMGDAFNDLPKTGRRRRENPKRP